MSATPEQPADIQPQPAIGDVPFWRRWLQSYVRRSDLPLHLDGSSRFLPWIVGVMVFLVALSVAGVMSLTDAMQRWETGLRGTVTVEVPPPVNAADEQGRDAEQRVAEIVKLLRETPGVGAAEAIDLEDTAEFLEPWLGDRDFIRDLPLPRLIDVEFETPGAIDAAALQARLGDIVPGTIVNDHGVWLDNLLTLGRWVQVAAGLVVVLVAAASVIAVVFATRAGLAIHGDAVELLHLIGARDDFIAGQFQLHALRLGLRGGMVGVLVACIAILPIQFAGHALPAFLLPRMTLTFLQWIGLLILPVLAALVTMVTARITVLRVLRRML